MLFAIFSLLRKQSLIPGSHDIQTLICELPNSNRNNCKQHNIVVFVMQPPLYQKANSTDSSQELSAAHATYQKYSWESMLVA